MTITIVFQGFFSLCERTCCNWNAYAKNYTAFLWTRRFATRGFHMKKLGTKKAKKTAKR
jgi:hypothetical protein